MNSEEPMVQSYAASDLARVIDQSGDGQQQFTGATRTVVTSPVRITRLERELLFTLGTGEGWNCLTPDGFGISLEPVGDGRAWDWTAHRSRWNAVDIGQSESRAAAIAAALKWLTNAGENVAVLPDAARLVAGVVLAPVVAHGLEQSTPSTAEFPSNR